MIFKGSELTGSNSSKSSFLSVGGLLRLRTLTKANSINAAKTNNMPVVETMMHSGLKLHAGDASILYKKPLSLEQGSERSERASKRSE